MSTQQTGKAEAGKASAPISWDYFVRRSSAGRRWIREYERFGDVDDACWDALVALRGRDLEVGRQLLDGAQGILLYEAPSAPDPIRWVLERWVFGVEAYYFYCINDFDGAELCLDRARRGVTSAVGALSFLLPLAEHYTDFELASARCARQQRRWEMMRRHIEVTRDMMTNRRPLCVLDDGSPIYARSVQQFYMSFDLSEEEQRAAEPLIDDCARLRAFERSVRAIYLLPGFVIPDP